MAKLEIVKNHPAPMSPTQLLQRLSVVGPLSIDFPGRINHVSRG
jgi:hypothetical protein